MAYINLSKNGFKLCEKVYEHLTDKASDVYADMDVAIYYNEEENVYAAADYRGAYIDTCGSSWKDVSEWLEAFAGDPEK